MKRIRNIYINSRGLTLVELLVAITLLGFVLTIATAMILPSYRIYDESTRRMSASQLAELAKTEVSGYLRMALQDTGNEFGEDLDKWIFSGYHRAEGDKIVRYKLEHDDEELKLVIEDPENGSNIGDYNRMIVNNVEKFYIAEINEGESVSLELYIKINDGNNIAEKRITVSPRNF